jgi:hypothetical protein
MCLQALPLLSPDLAERAHKTYRLQYLRDTALPRSQDDGALQTVNRTIQSQQNEIAVALLRDPSFLSQL